jgi:hypothetical protein
VRRQKLGEFRLISLDFAIPADARQAIESTPFLNFASFATGIATSGQQSAEPDPSGRKRLNGPCAVLGAAFGFG